MNFTSHLKHVVAVLSVACFTLPVVNAHPGHGAGELHSWLHAEYLMIIVPIVLALLISRLSKR